MRTISAILLLIVLSISVVHAQESEEIKHLKSLADSGDYAAAHQLGFAYTVGDGVAKDCKAADYWYSVAASRREQKPADQASPVTYTSPATNSLSFPFSRPKAVRGSSPHDDRFGSPNPSAYGLDYTPASRQATAEPSAWSKVKAYLSEHTDDITELATFAIERYLTGETPTDRTTTKSSDVSRPSK